MRFAFVEEAMGLVTADMFTPAPDPQVAKKQRDLTARYRCRVDPSDVSSAFNVLGRPPSPKRTERWTYLSQAKCWIVWFTEGVIDYLPSAPKSTR